MQANEWKKGEKCKKCKIVCGRKWEEQKVNLLFILFVVCSISTKITKIMVKCIAWTEAKQESILFHIQTLHET